MIKAVEIQKTTEIFFILPKLVETSCNKTKYYLSSKPNLTAAQVVSPNRLKIRVINPIHKSELTMLCLNYRTIPILPIFSKILEKMMNKRLMSFLTKHAVLYQNQYGSQGTKSRLTFKHNKGINKAGENLHDFFFQALS